jgi:N-carbamoyl-L-amino-acid hydrolase
MTPQMILAAQLFGALREASLDPPGAVAFSLDIRSERDAVVALMAEMAAEAQAQRRVTLDYGEAMGAPPTLMDPRLRAALRAGAAQAGVAVMEMTSGAGHDCASFVLKGVPSAMLFMRNQNGSHYPDEAMEMADFGAALSVLAGAIETIAAR